MTELIKNEKQNGSPLSLSQMCKTLGISRNALYNQGVETTTREKDIAVREAMHKVLVQFPTYGYRRIKKAIARDFGIWVNNKRILRIMREENLIRKRKSRPKVITTNSNHNLPIFPNLGPDMQVTGINQLWCADITYIHFGNDSVAYLAAILDTCSRRCIGWSLARHMREELTINALQMAIKVRGLTPGVNIGLVHHSDQGSQYAAKAYCAILEKYAITGSMSRKGNCYDNAMAESFNKTVKYDEVHLNEYLTFQQAYQSIERFIEDVYNVKRLHSSIGYVPPIEFEQSQCVALV